MPNLIARAHAATGDAVTALVLMRLLYRFEQAVKDGRTSTAQSYDDLMLETACSQKQVKRSVAMLKRGMFVEVKQSLFGNRNVNHFRLTKLAWVALKGQHVPYPEGQPELALEGQPNEAPEGQLYIQGETTGSYNKEISEQPLAGVSGVIVEEGSEEDELVKPKYTSVAEALANAAVVKPGSGNKLHKPDSVKTLELLWVKTLSDVTGKYAPPLTMKDVGLLKNFAKKCPTPTSVPVIIRYVIGNWISFVKQVEADAGIKITPAEPKLDFLLKHAGVAINMATPPKPKPKAPQEAKPVGIKQKPDKQLIAPDADALTPEEALAILSEDDDEGC